MRTIIFAFVSNLDEISDRAWAALAPHLAGKAGDVGRTGVDNRLFLNAVFWVARHGCAWRALPARFGKPPKTPKPHEITLISNLCNKGMKRDIKRILSS